EMGIASIRTEPSRITAGSPVDLTIRIENTGTADAKSVRAAIVGLSLPGTKEAFLGTIEPGNDGPAVFSLQTSREGEFPYTLTILYTDDYGEHATQQTLNLVVAESNSVPALVIAAAVLIVVIVAAAFWYRRRKRE
ncbi:MAG: S-layer protein, partial [Methanoculleus sp.]|nr:S-layer protein [Methanoculleus sp.]